MEFGLYHPSLGYWQSIGSDLETALSDAPQGTVQVPLKPTDGDYEFVADAWVRLPDPPELPPSQDDYKDAIQALIDDTARSRNYTDGNSCATYDNDPLYPQWDLEAKAFKAWRSTVWAYAYNQMYAVTQGQRPQPSVAELLSELPPIVWPEAPA